MVIFRSEFTLVTMELTGFLNLPEQVFVILGVIVIAISALCLRTLGAPIDEEDRPAEALAFSSHYLHFPEELVDVEEDPAIARRMIYYSTRAAAADLRDRNTRRKRVLQGTQKWLVFGLATLGLALLCYLWSSNLPQP